MYKPVLIIMIFCTHLISAQDIVEVSKREFSPVFGETFEHLRSFQDSGLNKPIEILETGLHDATIDYERYGMIRNLGALYTAVKQYDKAIELWTAANREGLFLPFIFGERTEPEYLSEYADNKKFLDFIKRNEELRNIANTNAQVEYFVNLPEGYSPGRQYPVIFVQHGGHGDHTATSHHWHSAFMQSDFISVFTQGRERVGSFTFRYGKTGTEDIKKVYRQVSARYPVDTSRIILAGQSAGGALSLTLASNEMPTAGSLLAFPVKPGDFDYKKAVELKNNHVRIVMICGEKDKWFFPGQQELSVILDSAGVENRFIKYPDLGHDFPPDFPEQINNGLHYLLKDEDALIQ